MTDESGETDPSDGPADDAKGDRTATPIEEWGLDRTADDPDAVETHDDTEKSDESPFDRLPSAPAGASDDLLGDVDDTIEPDGDVWSAIDPIEEADVIETAGERDVREVPIESYCRDCPHVSEPPDLACTYDGSDILAVPSMGVVRIADCPIVAERERLAEEW